MPSKKIVSSPKNLIISFSASEAVSFVDIFNSAIYCAFHIALVYFYLYVGEMSGIFMILWFIAAFVSTSSSTLYFFLVGVDRLYAILRPVRYHTRATKNGLKINIAAVWTLALIGGTLQGFSRVQIIPYITFNILLSLTITKNMI